MYRRLLGYLRPHARWMAGTVIASFVAAALDGLSLALLSPFLTLLTGDAGTPISRTDGAFPNLSEAKQAFNDLSARLVDPAQPIASLNRIILIILATVVAKNLFVWVSGQFGARLQEFVTRDLRNAVYAHLERLPLGFFTRTPTGHLITRVLNDSAQT